MASLLNPRIWLMISIGLLYSSCIGGVAATDDTASISTTLTSTTLTSTTLTSTTESTASESSRRGRSMWDDSNSKAGDADASTTEMPEMLPTPEALAFPVPAFIANLFSGGSTSRSAPPPPPPPPSSRTARRPVRRFNPQMSRERPRMRQERPIRQGRQPPRDREIDPRPMRQPPRDREVDLRPVRRHRPRDREVDYYGSDPVLDLDSFDDSIQFNKLETMESYDQSSDTSYAPRKYVPERQSILDSNAFMGAALDSHETRRRKEYTNTNSASFGRHNDKYFRGNDDQQEGMKWRKNYDSFSTDYNEADEAFLQQPANGYDEYGNKNTYDYSYDYDSNANSRNEIEHKYPNHKYQSEERPILDGIFSGMGVFNPMNYFRSREYSPPPPPPPSPPQYVSRMKPTRRHGGHTRYTPRQPEPVQFGRNHPYKDPEPVSVDFSELETFTRRDSGRQLSPDVSYEPAHFGRTVNTRGNQRRLFRDEVPFTDKNFRDHFPNSKRNRHESPTPRVSRRPAKRGRFQRTRTNDVTRISEEEIVLFPRDEQPHPPPRYDPRSGSLEGRENPNRNQHKFSHNSMSDEFNLIIPDSEIKHIDVPQLQEDPRLENFKFKEDSPLRDDLYVGKDGNIYLKGEATESRAAILTDSDSFLGLHMYGMDHPLFQEVSKSRISPIGPPSDSTSETQKQSRTISTISPAKNSAPINENKNSYINDLPRLKTTAHRRPSTAQPAETVSSEPVTIINPYYATPDEITPYVSDFAKTLVKVTKPKEEPVKKDTNISLHNLKD